jgi:hypothetical protein
VPYYPIIDLASRRPQASNEGVVAEMLTLGDEDEDVLPVLTSLARFWAFVDEYFAADDLLQPSTFPMDPFRLAEMIEPLGETSELSLLVLDPIAVSAGQWRSVNQPRPVAHYAAL